MTHTPLTEQRLDEITAIAARATEHPFFVSDCEGSLQVWREKALTHVRRDESGVIDMYSFPSTYKVTDQIIELDLSTWDPGEDATDDQQRQDIRDLVEARAALPALIADLRRARDRVAELEAYAHGCDAEGCVLPHSSWCDAAKKAAAANNGCTCGKPWTGHPQPHAMHCWTVNPPRAEVEEMRKRIAELTAAPAEPAAPAPASAPPAASHGPAGDRDGETGAEGVVGHVGDSGAMLGTAAADTLPAWLHQRFAVNGPTSWERLDDGQRAYWEHQARAVRRAVDRGGFKDDTASPAEETAR